MFEDHVAVGIDYEPDVKKALGDLRMMSLRLTHDINIVFARDDSKRVGFWTGDVDSAVAGVGNMVEIHDLIVKRLQRTFGKGDQTNRQVKPGEPTRRFDDMALMFDVAHDVFALGNPPHGGNQADGIERLDHDRVS